MKKAILYITLLLLTASCTIDSDDAPLGPRAVIEGWIDSDGYPRVLFTSAFIPGEQDATIADKMIRWGVVTISDGTKTVVMTGAPNKDLFPPYSYYTYEIKGVPGTTYTITADYKDIHATATCTMPEPPQVADISQTPIAGSDTLRAASISITNPGATRAFYHISTRVLPYQRSYLPAIMGCIAAEPRQTVSIPVFCGKTSTNTADFVPQLPAHRTVMIRVERVTPQVYAFWQAFNEATMFGGSMFVGFDTSLPGNIDGGFGIWSARGVAILRLDPL